MNVIPETYLMNVIPETYLMNVIPETNLMNVIPEARHAQSIGYLLCYHYHWVGTSAGVPENIIRPVVSASKLTWSIRYIHY